MRRILGTVVIGAVFFSTSLIVALAQPAGGPAGSGGSSGSATADGGATLGAGGSANAGQEAKPSNRTRRGEPVTGAAATCTAATRCDRAAGGHRATQRADPASAIAIRGLNWIGNGRAAEQGQSFFVTFWAAPYFLWKAGQRGCCADCGGERWVIHCPDVRSQIPDLSTIPSGGAATAPRVAALRAELKRRGRRRLCRAACRPAPERISAAFRRAPRLAHRLHRLGRQCGDPRRPRRALHRRPLHLAGARADRSFALHRRAYGGEAAWRMVGANLTTGAKLGYDPWLHTTENVEKLAKACAAAGATLVAMEPNPIDAIWKDRPPPPLGAVVLHDVRYAGEDASAKLARIREELKKLRADALVVSDPPALAWAFNIRGADVTHVPVALGFAIVGIEGRPCALSRRAQAHQRNAPRAGADRRRARARGFRQRPRRARRRQESRAAGSIDGGGCAGAHRHAERRDCRYAAPIRSPT